VRQASPRPGPHNRANENAAPSRYGELAARDGRIAAQLDEVPGEGWFCPPTVATGLPEDPEVLNEEIFGLLLALQAVLSVEAACDRVDELPFALTGGCSRAARRRSSTWSGARRSAIST
jgi:betaine-aldehyde dehydrogenase